MKLSVLRSLPLCRLTLSGLTGIVVLSAPVWAQAQRTVNYQDGYGRTSTAITATGTGGNNERFLIVNGRQVPLEQTEERVISQEAGHKVVERTVKIYGPNAKVSTTERHVVEETTKPGGSSTKETIYRTDINGHSQEAERRVMETRKQGQNVSSETTIQQPTVNGSFQTIERRNVNTTGPATNQQTTETVLRPDISQGFKEVQRLVTSTTVVGNQTTSNTANYLPGAAGAMQVANQTVAVTVKRPDGSEVVDTSFYGPTAGRADSSNAAQRIQEATRVERRVAKDGTVTEISSIRKALASDLNRLGPEEKLSEMVCKGKCLPDKPVEKAEALATTPAAPPANGTSAPIPAPKQPSTVSGATPPKP